MTADSLRIYYVDFDAMAALGVIRHPGATVCASIIQIKPDQLEQIRRESRGGVVPPAIVDNLLRGRRSV